MKVLFLVPYPTDGASNRIRVEQFVPYLRSKGIHCNIRPFINGRFYRILYMPRHYIEKIFWFVICTINRFLDIIRALLYDVIFVHREAYPFGGAFIEILLHRMGKPIIFDFDDAIFLSNTSEQNIYIERFKNPKKVSRIVRMSKCIIAGNGYLRDYAMQYNSNIVVIPSSIDTKKYFPLAGKPREKSIIVGWLGSNTTRRFLCDLEDVFVDLSKKYKNLIFKIVGAAFFSSKLTNIVNVKWSLDGELAELQSFDIGIMPMLDNEWTKGKCGFKALLYMACGIPVVASAVGINPEIIKDGENGFLATGYDEWIAKLSRLIEDEKMRVVFGLAGRRTIIDRYSLERSEPVFYKTLLGQFGITKTGGQNGR